jgi:hypothetical protein
LIVSQLLTLYTTPVIYVFFDRLALKITGSRHNVGTVEQGEREPA